MKEKNDHNPPKLADKFLEWYCQSKLIEDLQGDLHEHFQRNLSRGKFTANLIYWLDVLKFFRVYTVRKPKTLTQMTSLILMLNYWKTSIRNIQRNRLFSTINIVGLAISMSVGLLIITFIHELNSYDDFHDNQDRIYRIIDSYQEVGRKPIELASTSVFVGRQMETSFPEVESSVTLRRNFSGDARFEEKIIPIKGVWSSAGFFKVFSFELVQGNPNTAFDEPYSIVLSESTAAKLIDGNSYLGKIITLNGEDNYTITGIIKDPPKNSHIQFQALASLITFENSLENNEHFLSWSSVWMNYVYVLLKENADIVQFKKNLDRLAKFENDKLSNRSIELDAQAISSIVPGHGLSNKIGPNFSIEALYILGLLTFLVILSAAFNYTNLSIARSLRRSKEVGIRKVIGASKVQIFTQFICESIIIALVALILSFCLFLLLKPEFINLEDKIQEIASLEFHGVHAFYFMGFAVFIGILSGVLPAILLSKMKISSVLQNITSIKLLSGLSLRKVLIVIQFSLSMGFIIATFIVFKQHRFASNYDLGFSTENILNIKTQGNDHKILASYFEQIPEVKKISKSGFVPNTGEVWGAIGKYKDPLDSARLIYNSIDENYLQNHDYPLVAGTYFRGTSNSDKEENVIVNEKLLERFQIGKPEAAINEILEIDGLKLKILGVLKDFHHNNLEKPIQPFIFRYRPKYFYVLNLKIESTDIQSTINTLSDAWEKVDKVHPFEAEFFDIQIQNAYQDFIIVMKITGFMAFLSISIATFGLLGMAVYVTESRLKEISIRKVLGATEKNLILLLSKSFVLLLLLAVIITIPLTYVLFDQIVLADIVYRAPIGWLELFSGAFIIFLIGVSTIALQTSSAVNVNPAENLKDE